MLNFCLSIFIRYLLGASLIINAFHVQANQAVSTDAIESIPLYTYHNGGPFITGDNSGLTYELAKFLNHEAKGRWTFPVIKQARLRFNRDVQSAKTGIVPWVKPAWLKKLKLQGDLWSMPYFKDANVIVSRVDKKVDYTGATSLFGLTVAKVKGAVQVGIDPYIETGQIKVVNSTDFEGHMRMLKGGRADFVSTSLNIAKYTIAKLGLEKDLYISMRPIDQYTRHIMVLNENEALLQFINHSIHKMANDPKWFESMKMFGAQDLRVTEFN